MGSCSPFGMLNIDKPHGMTSHDVVDVVREVARLRRVGHAGTLDLLATGVLVVCIGKATRLSEYVMEGSKEYLAHVRFGIQTDTYDAEGRIVSQQSVEGLDRERVESAVDVFRGEIQQIPPMYSALKHGGKALYELARKGVTVTRNARPVTIEELEILSWENPNLELRIVCSKGTYIRSLAHDLGQRIGVGAFLAGLRRSRVGTFTAADAVGMKELREAGDNWEQFLVSPAVAFVDKARVQIEAETVRRIGFGQSVPLDVCTAEAPCFAFNEQWRLIAVMVPADREGLWRPDKVFV